MWPHTKAEHMAAPDQSVKRPKTLLPRRRRPHTAYRNFAPEYGEGLEGRPEALPVEGAVAATGGDADRLCSTITGLDSAPGAEQRQRSSPEAEPLIRRADRKCAARFSRLR